MTPSSDQSDVVARGSLCQDQNLGSIAPGFYADIVAVAGNPLRDITELQRVKFVMKGGTVNTYPIVRRALDSSSFFGIGAVPALGRWARLARPPARRGVWRASWSQLAPTNACVVIARTPTTKDPMLLCSCLRGLGRAVRRISRSPRRKGARTLIGPSWPRPSASSATEDVLAGA